MSTYVISSNRLRSEGQAISRRINMAFKHWLKYCKYIFDVTCKGAHYEVHTLRQHLDQEKAFRELELGKADAKWKSKCIVRKDISNGAAEDYWNVSKRGNECGNNKTSKAHHE